MNKEMNLYQMEMNLFQKVQIKKIIMKRKTPLLYKIK